MRVYAPAPEDISRRPFARTLAGAVGKRRDRSIRRFAGHTRAREERGSRRRCGRDRVGRLGPSARLSQPGRMAIGADCRCLENRVFAAGSVVGDPGSAGRANVHDRRFARLAAAADLHVPHGHGDCGGFFLARAAARLCRRVCGKAHGSLVESAEDRQALAPGQTAGREF